MLSSAPMCSLTGEDVDEAWRPNSNLWDEAMRRNDWVLVRHLRGDGKGQPVELGGIPPVKKEVPSEFKTRLTAQWNRNAGSALILTDEQYMDIRKRAGFPEDSGMGLDAQLAKALKPLVKDYVIPHDPEIDGHEEPHHHHRH